jgi:hypothetical protein
MAGAYKNSHQTLPPRGISHIEGPHEETTGRNKNHKTKAGYAKSGYPKIAPATG